MAAVCVLFRVTFDEQQPHQLMILLNEVLGAIDDSQKVRIAWFPARGAIAGPTLACC